MPPDKVIGFPFLVLLNKENENHVRIGIFLIVMGFIDKCSCKWSENIHVYTIIKRTYDIWWFRRPHKDEESYSLSWLPGIEISLGYHKITSSLVSVACLPW